MLLGGGGSPSAATELALQLVLAALVAGWAWIIPPARLQALPRGVWQVAGLIVVLPLLQLLPLPPWLWHALPGRQLEIASLTLVGQQNSWRPLSLTPYQTLASLLAMAAAAAMLVMAAALNRTGRTVVLSAVVTVALVSLVVGEVQIAGGSANLLQFYDSDGGWLLGFQGNHNAQADVLLIAIVACATVARELITQPRRKVQKRVILGVAVVSLALLTLGVVLTASRTGVALLAIALSSALVIMRPLAGLSWRQTLWAIGGGGALFWAPRPCCGTMRSSVARCSDSMPSRRRGPKSGRPRGWRRGNTCRGAPAWAALSRSMRRWNARTWLMSFMSIARTMTISKGSWKPA